VLAVTDAQLDDLTARVRGMRWPQPWPDTSWEAGTDHGELRRLADRWSSGFDWRAQEAAINALPHRFADIDGTPVHYLRFEGEGPDPRPIVLTHGWPSSFLELVGLGRRLAADGFTAIVPSLPGFGLSPQRPTVPPDLPTHELWHRLMHDELGFTQYAAHGGDLGAGVTARLAEAHPEHVVGIHLLAIPDPVGVDPASVTEEEQAYRDSVETWFEKDGGYEHEQMTRPVTLAYGLADSPVGLLAWILEKYHAWTDHGGDLSTVFSDDYVLSQASLWWFTNTISSSFRPYYEHARGLHEPVASVGVPTALAVFPHDLVQPPRSWAERTFEVVRYTRMPRGGHFAAYETPDLLADDITEFLRSLA
jgi:pimeloyl-ACP methyl ester carboxylesterase